MALSRSLLAGHVLQSPASRPRKHGQQRHLLRARDSARWKQPAQHSPPSASLPGLARPARPTRVPHSSRWAPQAEGKARLEGSPGGHTQGGKPGRRGASTQKHSTRTPRQKAPERARARAGLGAQPGSFCPRQPGKVSWIPQALRHTTPGVHSKELWCGDAAKISWGAAARRAARAERPRSWPAPRNPEDRPGPGAVL